MNPFVKQKIKFHYFFCMLLLLFLHNYNLVDRVLTPSSLVGEPLRVTTYIEIFLSNSVFRFRLPLLLAISGYLFYTTNHLPYVEMIGKKFKSLLIPAFLISVIGVFITLGFEYLILGNHPETTKGLIGKSVLNFDIRDWLYFTLREPVTFQLWFLKTLFLLNLASPVINYALKKAPVYTMLLLLVVYLSTHLLDTNSRDRAIIYYVFGVYVAMYGKNILTPIKYIPVLPVALLFIGVCFVRANLAFYTQPTYGIFDVKWLLMFLFKVNEILGTYAVWFGMDGVVVLISRQKLYQKVSGSSFFIYAFHSPTMLFANTMILNAFNDVPNIRLMAYFTLPVATFFVLVVIDKIVKTNLPNFYDTITGGRGKKRTRKEGSLKVVSSDGLKVRFAS